MIFDSSNSELSEFEETDYYLSYDSDEDYFEELVEGDGLRCQACYGTGLDRELDADCLECWGDGWV